MKDMEYITAVARIRVNENYLLTKTDIERFVDMPYEDIIRTLSDKGWDTESDNLYDIFKNENERLWKLIKECAPDFDEFAMFITQNDFHNYKSILKGTMKGVAFDKYLLSPSLISTDAMERAVAQREFNDLPEYMRGVAEKAYEAMAHTGDGQYADTLIDRAMLDSILFFAEKPNISFLRDLAEITIVSYNFRIAARGAKMGKSPQLMEAALAPSSLADVKALNLAVSKGLTDIADYLDTIGFDDGAAVLKDKLPDLSDFESWCDRLPVEFALSHKSNPFSIAPLASFILNKRHEIKNVRIILSCKKAGISSEIIRKRAVSA